MSEVPALRVRPPLEATTPASHISAGVVRVIWPPVPVVVVTGDPLLRSMLTPARTVLPVWSVRASSAPRLRLALEPVAAISAPASRSSRVPAARFGAVELAAVLIRPAMRIPRLVVIVSEPLVPVCRMELPTSVITPKSSVAAGTVTATAPVAAIHPPRLSEVCRLRVVEAAVSPESGVELLGVCRLTLRISAVLAVMTMGSRGARKSPSTISESVSSEIGSLIAASMMRVCPVALMVVMLKASPSRMALPGVERPIVMLLNPSASAARSRVGRSSFSRVSLVANVPPPPFSAAVPSL